LTRNLDAHYLHLALYAAAFLQNDEKTMRQQLEWAKGRSGEEDWLMMAQAYTEAYFGRLTRAREFSQRAVESARHADAAETAAVWDAVAALREVEVGAQVRRRAESGVSTGHDDAGYWLPSIRAAIDLHEGHGAKAIESLQPAISFELGRPPPFSTLWKDADADIPPLREAKTEAARLSS
jgi:hypothetical protein